MRRRLPVLPLMLVVCALALSGCASEAPVDLDAARAWVEGMPRDDAGVIGSATMIVGPADDLDADEDPTGITLEFAVPATVTHAEVSCYGGSTAAFTMAVTASTESFSGGADIPCDEKPHTVAVADTPISEVTSVTVDATSDVLTYLYAAVIGTAAED